MKRNNNTEHFTFLVSNPIDSFILLDYVICPIISFLSKESKRFNHIEKIGKTRPICYSILSMFSYYIHDIAKLLS